MGIVRGDAWNFNGPGVYLEVAEAISRELLPVLGVRAELPAPTVAASLTLQTGASPVCTPSCDTPSNWLRCSQADVKINQAVIVMQRNSRLSRKNLPGTRPPPTNVTASLARRKTAPGRSG